MFCTDVRLLFYLIFAFVAGTLVHPKLKLDPASLLYSAALFDLFDAVLQMECDHMTT